MGQVVSFINMKGGVGKTTLAVNVAYGLGYYHDKSVLLVDGDPQFNASTYLMTDQQYLEHIQDPKKRTLRDIYVPRRSARLDTVDGLAKHTRPKKIPLASCLHHVLADDGKLDLIPSTLGLMEIETSKRGTENRLHNFIAEKAGAYDYVIIDCPPTISIFTQAAILASQKYLVPVKPDPLSTIGLPLLERWLEEFTSDAGVSIASLGIVFCLVRGPLPKRMKRVMADLRQTRPEEVFDDHLSEATAVAESVEEHQPIFLYKANSKPARQIQSITQEFLDRTLGA